MAGKEFKAKARTVQKMKPPDRKDKKSKDCSRYGGTDRGPPDGGVFRKALFRSCGR